MCVSRNLPDQSPQRKKGSLFQGNTKTVGLLLRHLPCMPRTQIQIEKFTHWKLQNNTFVLNNRASNGEIFPLGCKIYVFVKGLCSEECEKLIKLLLFNYKILQILQIFIEYTVLLAVEVTNLELTTPSKL